MTEGYIEVLTTLANNKSPKEGFSKKLIKIQTPVMQKMQDDADRCRRSLNKHIEAILVAYLDIENVELNNVRQLRKQFNRPTELDPLADEIIDLVMKRQASRGAYLDNDSEVLMSKVKQDK